MKTLRLNDIYTSDVVQALSTNNWKKGFSFNSFQKKTKEKIHHIDFETKSLTLKDFELIHYIVEELDFKTNKVKSFFIKDSKELEKYICNI